MTRKKTLKEKLFGVKFDFSTPVENVVDDSEFDFSIDDVSPAEWKTYIDVNTGNEHYVMVGKAENGDIYFDTFEGNPCFMLEDNYKSYQRLEEYKAGRECMKGLLKEITEMCRLAIKPSERATMFIEHAYSLAKCGHTIDELSEAMKVLVSFSRDIRKICALECKTNTFLPIFKIE